MPKQQITTNLGAAPVGPYSPGLRAGDFIFVSGQGPLDPVTGKIVGATIEEQTVRVLENIKVILEAGGATMADVVKANAFLSDISFFEPYNKIYGSYFPDPRPTRTTMVCQPPIKGILIEIEVIAFVGKE
jgi:2-iminobutanoate/2-iminopropanoate deaminase